MAYETKDCAQVPWSISWRFCKYASVKQEPKSGLVRFYGDNGKHVKDFEAAKGNEQFSLSHEELLDLTQSGKTNQMHVSMGLVGNSERHEAGNFQPNREFHAKCLVNSPTSGKTFDTRVCQNMLITLCYSRIY